MAVNPTTGAPAVNPNTAWKAPIEQTFQTARAAASTPGVGITNIPALQAAQVARREAIRAAKPMGGAGGFQGDPNSLVPRGQTSGGVNQYYNPSTGGMFVGNPFGSGGGGGGGGPSATAFAGNNAAGGGAFDAAGSGMDNSNGGQYAGFAKGGIVGDTKARYKGVIHKSRNK